MSFDDDLTTHAMYLMAGATYTLAADCEQQWHPEGNLGMAADLLRLAPLVKLSCDELWDKYGEFPGVYLYEVTEEMGVWYVLNPHCADAEFLAELSTKNKHFITQLQPDIERTP